VVKAEERLWNTILEGDLEQFRQIILSNPELNINWAHPGYTNWTALHNAASSGMPEFVKLLLRHPGVDVNLLDTEGKTPFLHAANNSQETTLLLLLQDVRVDVNRPDPNGATPLWLAAFRGDAHTLRLMIASGRQFDIAAKTTRSPVPHAELARITAFEAAKKNGQAETATLLEKYKINPQKFAENVRLQNNIAPLDVRNPGRLSPAGFKLLLQKQDVPDSAYEIKPCGCFSFSCDLLTHPALFTLLSLSLSLLWCLLSLVVTPAPPAPPPKTGFFSSLFSS